MKVLIVYDSVSPSKLTMEVAKTIGETLKEKGIDASVVYFGDVDKSTIKDYDCLMVGAPTMAFRPSQGITGFLNDLALADQGKRAAAFDTQVQMIISGNAAKGIDKKLRSLGFTIFKEPLVTYVEGSSRKNEYRFKPDMLEKAKKWAEEASGVLAS